MPDLDGLEEALKASPVVRKCPVQRAIDSFEGNLQVLIANAVEERDPITDKYVWSAHNLVNLLYTKADIRMDETTMSRHRRGACSCRPEGTVNG